MYNEKHKDITETTKEEFFSFLGENK